MYTMQEKNAQRSRQLAVVLTIAVHLLAAAALYFQSASAKTTTPMPVTLAKEAPTQATARPVAMP